ASAWICVSEAPCARSAASLKSSNPRPKAGSTVRAETPAISGSVHRDGVRIAYEVFGPEGAPVIVLLPSWIIVHARAWKAQVADLARDLRVVVIDGRGNGRSDRPVSPEAYVYGEYVGDA